MAGSPTDGSFLTTGDAYDAFMGRYSNALATLFADASGLRPGMAVLDVGCGPGALTDVLVSRVGAPAVSAVDPSPPFVEACAARCPGVDVRQAGAESLPFAEDSFDAVLSQLVLHFVDDPETAAREFGRVLRPGGSVAACVWDFAEEMEMLRLFWDAALEIDPDAPDEARVLRFGGPGELAGWLDGSGFEDVTEFELSVTSAYSDFDELWHGFRAGIGPAGAYCGSLDDERRETLRQALYRRLGEPDGGFTLQATARAAKGNSPG